MVNGHMRPFDLVRPRNFSLASAKSKDDLIHYLISPTFSRSRESSSWAVVASVDSEIRLSLHFSIPSSASSLKCTHGYKNDESRVSSSHTVTVVGASSECRLSLFTMEWMRLFGWRSMPTACFETLCRAMPLCGAVWR